MPMFGAVEQDGIVPPGETLEEWEVSPSLSLRFLLRDPQIRAGIEQIERKGTTVKHLVVELANVKLGPQLFPGAFAEFAELELAELVTERLCGPRDVTVGLGLDRRFIDRAGLAHEVHDLIACPSFRVNSRVND